MAHRRSQRSKQRGTPDRPRPAFIPSPEVAKLALDGHPLPAALVAALEAPPTTPAEAPPELADTSPPDGLGGPDELADVDVGDPESFGGSDF